MIDWLWLTNLVLGFSLGYSYARYRAFQQYWNVEQRVVEAIKKAGVRVYEGDVLYVAKKERPAQEEKP